MSENSATCANCRPLFPLPCPVLRPPLASTNSGTVQPSRRKRKNRREMIHVNDNGGGDEAVQSTEDGAQKEFSRRIEDIKTAEERGVAAATVAEPGNNTFSVEQQQQRHLQHCILPLSRQSAKIGKIWHSSEGSGRHPSANFRLRRPIERFRQLFVRRPMLEQMLNPAFKRFMKRCFRLLPSASVNVRVLPRRVLRHPRRSVSISTAITAKRRVALRLRRRCIRYAPLPRLPPFQCPKCALLTRQPRIMLNHICAKKLPEFKNVNQIVELGFRSRVRDAMSVLERVPNPQAMQFNKYCSPLTAADHRTLHQPLELSEIALKCVQRPNVLQIVQTQKVPFDQSTEQNLEPTTNEMIAVPSSSTAFFCTICDRLFARYACWDAHLMDDEEAEDGIDAGVCPYNGQHPMLIQCPSNEMIPRNGLPIKSASHLADESVQSVSGRHQRWRCSACALQQFSTRAEFHAHILKCALATAIF